MQRLVMIALSAALIGAATGQARAQLSTPRPLLSPVGVWRTFDDKTGRERGLVRIREEQGQLVGTIIGTVDPAEGARTCEKCEDERRGQPILGLMVLRGLQPDGDGWDGGRILDPETGSVYRCSAHLADAGRTLILRGYLGISLFGRTQSWLRTP
jgi:uncharacterized protein (DUF2147 family)